MRKTFSCHPLGPAATMNFLAYSSSAARRKELVMLTRQILKIAAGGLLLAAVVLSDCSSSFLDFRADHQTGLKSLPKAPARFASGRWDHAHRCSWGRDEIGQLAEGLQSHERKTLRGPEGAPGADRARLPRGAETGAASRARIAQNPLFPMQITGRKSAERPAQLDAKAIPGSLPRNRRQL